MKLEHLIKYFQPEHYDLILTIDRPNRTFTGAITINGSLTEQSEVIKLHANDLTIRSVASDGINLDFKYQNNIIEIKPPHTQSKQTITIDYAGKITDEMTGIYPCYYTLNNQSKEIIATQFESHYAREVFPCVDEPLAKATFALTLITENEQTVLSNMPIAKQSVKIDQLITQFATTPKMSSYCLAFVIGEFNKKTILTKNGTEVNIFATKAQSINNLDFALEIAQKALEFFEDYLGVNYPLPKCDHVALPDFAAGAMENWGLVTYRESALLTNSNDAIASQKYVASVIAHELSHMWFGNLVTMRWWDELWLNESLASVLEAVAVDFLKPEYNIWDDFYANNYQYARAQDCLPGVQAIITPVDHPDEITTIFDSAIVYAKGACIMLMLKNYIGETNFKQALKTYLSNFHHQNPTTDDLIKTFSTQSNQDINSLLMPWLKQSSFPIVEARLEYNYLVLNQTNFGYKADKLWQIPLKPLDKNLPKLLITPQTKLIFDQNSTSALLNDNMASYFITNYDINLKEKIRKNLIESSKLNQLFYLTNQILLAKNNYIQVGDLITDLNYFKDSDHLIIWSSLATIFNNLKFFVAQTAQEPIFKKMVIDITKNKFEQLALTPKTNDSIEQRELRLLLLGWLSYANYPKATNYLIDLFNKNQTNLSQIDANIRAVCLTAKLKYDFCQALFSNLFNHYQQTHDPALKRDLRSALTSVHDIIAIEVMLNSLLDSAKIKSQDILTWHSLLLSNRKSKELSWIWLKNNFDALVKKFFNDKSYSGFVEITAKIFYKSSELADYLEFFKKYQNDLALKRIFEVGATNITLRQQYFDNGYQAVIEKINSYEVNSIQSPIK